MDFGKGKKFNKYISTLEKKDLIFAQELFDD